MAPRHACRLVERDRPRDVQRTAEAGVSVSDDGDAADADHDAGYIGQFVGGNDGEVRLADGAARGSASREIESIEAS